MSERYREHLENKFLENSAVQKVVKELQAEGYNFQISEDSSELFIDLENNRIHFTKIYDPADMASEIRKAIEESAKKSK